MTNVNTKLVINIAIESQNDIGGIVFVITIESLLQRVVIFGISPYKACILLKCEYVSANFATTMNMSYFLLISLILALLPIDHSEAAPNLALKVLNLT